MNQPHTVFTVLGPRSVPTYRGRASRTITDEDVRAFWRANGDVSALRGCYAFAVAVGERMKPGYVGKATRSFRQEVFQYHKRVRYQQMLADHRVGTPLLFFVALPRRRGPPHSKHVAYLEQFLIETAHAVNPRLLNARCLGAADAWAIEGVSRRASGKPTTSARLFNTLMRIRR